jgi:hypothetical protein
MRFSSSVPLRRRVGWIRLKDEYVSALGLTYPFGTQLADDLTTEGLLAEVDTKIERLQRLLANLDAYEGPADDGTPATGPKGSATVFIVHGRASTPRLEVENLVRRATDVEPVMLADQISGGAVTLIEKPEEHLGQDSSATFAVIAARWPDLSSTGIRPSRFSVLSARSTSACVAARSLTKSWLVMSMLKKGLPWDERGTGSFRRRVAHGKTRVNLLSLRLTEVPGAYPPQPIPAGDKAPPAIVGTQPGTKLTGRNPSPLSETTTYTFCSWSWWVQRMKWPIYLGGDDEDRWQEDRWRCGGCRRSRRSDICDERASGGGARP